MVQTSTALPTHPRRGLAGIHHTTKYTPKVVKKSPTPAPSTFPEGSDDSDSDSYDSYEQEGSIDVDLKGSDEADVDLKGSEELDIESSQDVDMDVDGSADMDVELGPHDGLDFSGEGDQTVDLDSSEDMDFDASASLGASGQLDADIEFTDGSVDVDIDDDEDYSQELEFEDNEVVDEIIDVPEGAKSIHLRVHRGNVDLDIIKSAQFTPKSEEAKPEAKKEEEQKEEAPAQEEKNTEVAAATTEESVSYAAEAKEWVEENGSKPAFLGGIIGAAVGIVGVAGVAIAKRRKRTSAKSVLEADVEADEAAAAEEDEDASESDSDEDSDEDVEAGVQALTEEDKDEEKKTSVVEGSVSVIGINLSIMYGIGVDLALVPRFERSFARFGKRFLRRAFHPKEIEEFYARPSSERAVYLASRWAVKEATFKAFQSYRVLFPEIYAARGGVEGPRVPTFLPVTKDSKALRLEFSGETAALAQQLRLVDPLVSISHDGDYAVAYVLLQQEGHDDVAPASTATWK
ncbi:hypothetical protein BBO99_00002556 [Phytophthora kernoviae]|uniref:4'-phosphopantetheinyl transferase domain-containing protein n=1 Tax=Phytophthora kernoviae TaxID=325452 RepID=A0A421GWI6_9STRA|nr:hypothetical protein BBI17_002455 [Phytophthora kernoviae]RLN82860.1 hypothetical protein BBO99_00002556 [Phytophthora kernoviae]